LENGVSPKDFLQRFLIPSQGESKLTEKDARDLIEKFEHEEKGKFFNSKAKFLYLSGFQNYLASSKLKMSVRAERKEIYLFNY